MAAVTAAGLTAGLVSDPQLAEAGVAAGGLFRSPAVVDTALVN